MRYKTYLISFLLLGTCPSLVFAEAERYRVEILVLTHLQHTQQARQAEWPGDYSASLDFLTPVTEEEAADSDDDPETETGATDGDVAAIDGTEEAEEEEIPADAVIHVEEMSEVMQETWRRLRLSAPFRPQQYLSWEQGGEAPFPSLRVHDLDTVMTIDPYANVRDAMQDLDLIISEETAGSGASNPGGSEFTETGFELPPPTYYYRLDGSVMLKRTRFLHLEVDIQLREALYENLDDPASTNLRASALATREKQPRHPDQLAVEESGMETVAAEPIPSSFLVQEILQSRQVKTGRMEYFDSPVLGVLAYITTIETEEPSEASGN